MSTNKATPSQALLTLAKSFKLDVERLSRGETVAATIVVSTPQEMKKLLAIPTTPDTYDLVAKTMALNGEAPDSYEAGLKHFSAYACGVSNLDTSIGSAFFKKRFPMEIRMVASSQIELTSDYVVNPGSPPVYIACDELIFNGGSYVIQSTNFTLWVTSQLTIESSGSRPYHIGILGSPGGPGSNGANGGTQSQAPNGQNSSPASPGVCTGSGSGGNGTVGNTGYNGGAGGNGMNGVASVVANINIANFASPQAPLVVFGMSGTGGNGGSGGNGGTGQQGGNGGNGCNAGCEGTNGGNGANGGAGGNGGNGANGGNGVNGGAIYLNLNPSQQSANFYTYMSQQAAPGQGGAGGAAGQGGAGGTGGSGGHSSSDGTNGNTGASGNTGANGASGAAYGTPPQLMVASYKAPSNSELQIEVRS
ncbi:hypothetical protein [Burkholderia sp. Bp9031]|uniref:hypothetical protein n=1 Tax=Burkholderia sp. Bp9031 TaxID=2184566 RepID=UPI000F5F4EFC|nr:hypothetical protein [Burkholderia sp. Bp9031]